MPFGKLRGPWDIVNSLDKNYQQYSKEYKGSVGKDELGNLG